MTLRNKNVPVRERNDNQGSRTTCRIEESTRDKGESEYNKRGKDEKDKGDKQRRKERERAKEELEACPDR